MHGRTPGCYTQTFESNKPGEGQGPPGSRGAHPQESIPAGVSDLGYYQNSLSFLHFCSDCRKMGPEPQSSPSLVDNKQNIPLPHNTRLGHEIKWPAGRVLIGV